MNQQFKVDDRVRLKSGSPIMTVKSVGQSFGEEVEVRTVWFDKAEVKTATFPPEALEPAA
jgi:uncharacterized protein YodC (DUF2158 family)